MDKLKKKYNKRILVVTHQLSFTGAPIVLLDVIRLLKKSGCIVEVITMADGKLREDIEELDIPITVMPRILAEYEKLYTYAMQFDLVIANTLITLEAIHILKGSAVPVIWWIHEGRPYFEELSSVMPDFKELSDNIHIYSVSPYVQNTIKQMHGFETKIFHFEVKDFPAKDLMNDSEDNRMRFMSVGTYSFAKAQEILAGAINMLPEKYMEKCEFSFYGDEEIYDPKAYDPVKKLTGKYKNVHMCGQVSHEKILEKMEESDCLIVSSRLDSMPTVAAEMMMKSRVCLCTSACGISYYIKDGVNGYTVPPDDPKALSEKIMYIVDHRNECRKIAENGRKLYEEKFSPQVIEPQILDMVYDFTHPKENQMRELASCIQSLIDAEKNGEMFSDAEREQIAQNAKLVTDYVKENYETYKMTDEEILRDFLI